MFILEIVLTFIKIGTLCFGGGYASISIVEREIVNIKGWLSYQEFFDLLAIDEITPGPIIINAATFIGTKISGIIGALSATLGSILIPCILSLTLVIIYRKYKDLRILNDILSTLKSMSFALILSTMFTIFLSIIFKNDITSFSNINYFLFILIIVSFVLIKKFNLYPIVVMLICGILNVLINIM